MLLTIKYCSWIRISEIFAAIKHNIYTKGCRNFNQWEIFKINNNVKFISDVFQSETVRKLLADTVRGTMVFRQYYQNFGPIYICNLSKIQTPRFISIYQLIISLQDIFNWRFNEFFTMINIENCAIIKFQMNKIWKSS